MYIYHDSRNLQYRSPFGAVPVSTEVQISLDLKECAPEHVWVRLWTDHEERIPMTTGDQLHWTASVSAPDTPCLMWYYFIIETDASTVYYGRPSDSHKGTGAVMKHPESWQITVYQPTVLPEWYRKSVVYQIFPDRFARGKDFAENQVRAAHPDDWKGTSRIIMQNWNDAPFYVRDAEKRVTGWPFFGGSLQGIRSRLPYLQSLGIGVIYLNPIFLASSNHKYDTANYMQLDPTFGTEADFTELCQEARSMGIQIILDGVFSHTGDDSIYFNRYGNFPEPGARSALPSPYDDWYRFGAQYPKGWDCWWGVDSLPNVEETTPSYQEYIAGENGVIQKWLHAGASGWRLDVADELPDSFIVKLRSAVKSAKEDGLLLGEVWEDASNKISYNELRRYLLGDELDCTMHYPFRTGALNYLLGKESAEELADSLTAILENYPLTAQQGALNLIGTHDTPRILTVLGEAPELEDDQQRAFYRLNNTQKEKAKLRLKLLQVLQFSVPGVPCIYYGDEAGMQGYADPYNRGTFPWNNPDGDLQYHVRMLGAFRKEYAVFTEGDTSYSALSEDLFCIRRTYRDETLLVICNRSADYRTATVPEAAGQWLELTGGAAISGPDLVLLPYGYLMLYRNGREFQPLNISAAPDGAGVLCPMFSLPCKDNRQAFDYAANTFLPALQKIGCRSWMLLPMNPVGDGNSPYSSRCLFAGDPRFVSDDLPVDPAAFSAWREENSEWVEDYALYTILREQYDCAWQEWPAEVRDRRNLSALLQKHADRMTALCLQQYRFSLQWEVLHQRAKELGIALIGDIPIYAALDSADAWANRGLFLLDEKGYPTLRAGCPPDYFNLEGQDWGNPLYRWDLMQKDDYSWWMRRLAHAFSQYDYVRLDHFRGFSSYYAIPSDTTAKHGVWMKGPGLHFFEVMAASFGHLPVIAEDLGTLDSMVSNLLARTGFCGMKVWQFSHEEMKKLSEAEAAKRVFFSGTHDNQTLKSFLADSEIQKDAPTILEELLASPAQAVIIPVQDLLGLGDEARINVPGIPKGNWTWKMDPEMLEDLSKINYFLKKE